MVSKRTNTRRAIKAQRRRSSLKSTNTATKFRSSTFMQWVMVLEPLGVVIALLGLGIAYFYGNSELQMSQYLLEVQQKRELEGAYVTLSRADEASALEIKNAIETLHANGKAVPIMTLRCRNTVLTYERCTEYLDLSFLNLGAPTMSAAGDLTSVDFSNVSFNFAELESVRFHNSVLQSVTFEYANLTNASLAAAVGDGVSFAGAMLRDVEMRYARFVRTDVTGANFSRADLRFTKFQMVRWRRSEPDFSNANISGAHFGVADGQGVDALKNAWAWESYIPTFSENVDAPAFLVCAVGEYSANTMEYASAKHGPPTECIAENLRFDVNNDRFKRLPLPPPHRN